MSNPLDAAGIPHEQQAEQQAQPQVRTRDNRRPQTGWQSFGSACRQLKHVMLWSAQNAHMPTASHTPCVLQLPPQTVAAMALCGSTWCMAHANGNTICRTLLSSMVNELSSRHLLMARAATLSRRATCWPLCQDLMLDAVHATH